MKEEGTKGCTLTFIFCLSFSLSRMCVAIFTTTHCVLTSRIRLMRSSAAGFFSCFGAENEATTSIALSSPCRCISQFHHFLNDVESARLYLAVRGNLKCNSLHLNNTCIRIPTPVLLHLEFIFLTPNVYFTRNTISYHRRLVGFRFERVEEVFWQKQIFWETSSSSVVRDRKTINGRWWQKWKHFSHHTTRWVDFDCCCCCCCCWRVSERNFITLR